MMSLSMEKVKNAFQARPTGQDTPRGQRSATIRRYRDPRATSGARPAEGLVASLDRMSRRLRGRDLHARARTQLPGSTLQCRKNCQRAPAWERIE